MESSKWGDMPGNGANFKLRQQRVMRGIRRPDGTDEAMG